MGREMEGGREGESKKDIKGESNQENPRKISKRYQRNISKSDVETNE